MQRSARDAARVRFCVAAAAGLTGAWAGGVAGAGIITDPSFFAPIAAQTTTLTFDVDGDGSAVSLIQGQSLVMPVAEYQSQGAMFNSVRWVNDGNASFDAAQALLGLDEIAIPGSAVPTFEISFTGAVRAVGMWVINNASESEDAPTITAYNAQGDEIEFALFGGGFVDGTVGLAQYGFMGVVTDEPIAMVRVTKDAAIVDNVMFSAVPSPGAAGVLGLGMAWLARRRR